jgi:universal stress protein A
MTGSDIIVVGFDFSELGEMALNKAILLAGHNRAELHVVHVTVPIGPAYTMDGVYPRLAPTTQDVEKSVIDRVRHRLEAIADKGIDAAIVHVKSGDVATDICDVGRELEADLIVVGTHGRQGVVRLLLGSVAEGVVRAASCPVLVVRPKTVLEVPDIESACQLCLDARRASRGREMWCEQHQHNLGRRHTYHYVPRSVAAQENMPLVVASTSTGTDGE